MLVIPDQHLDYPELGWNNAGFPDNLAIADNNLARGLIRAFPLNGRQTRSLVRYVIDEGFEPEKRITRINIEHRGGRPWFNGSSSYIEYMTPHHVREDEERHLFTMSVRFRPDRQGQTEYVMGGLTGYVSIRLQAGVVQFIRQGQAVLAADPNGAIQAGIDHTVTVIYDRFLTLDGVNAEFLYVDGRLVGTGTNTVSFSFFAAPMVLGRLSPTSTSSQFRGMIDNVLWWKRALTPGEIAALSRRPMSVYRAI